MLRDAAQWISAAVWVAICGYALWRGPAGPRLVGGALLLNLLEVFALAPLDRPYHVHLSLLLGDLFVMAVAIYAWRVSHSAWLALAIGFQALSIATHAAKALDRTLGGWGYVTLAALWGYAVLACLVGGVISETRGKAPTR